MNPLLIPPYSNMSPALPSCSPRKSVRLFYHSAQWYENLSHLPITALRQMQDLQVSNPHLRWNYHLENWTSCGKISLALRSCLGISWNFDSMSVLFIDCGSHHSPPKPPRLGSTYKARRCEEVRSAGFGLTKIALGWGLQFKLFHKALYFRFIRQKTSVSSHKDDLCICNNPN